MLDLGIVNEWAPEAYTKHVKAQEQGEKHKVARRRLHTGLTEYQCHTCGIVWRVDQGD